jgi:type 2 lantibiotic biosynthesis protein LanM
MPLPAAAGLMTALLPLADSTREIVRGAALASGFAGATAELREQLFDTLDRGLIERLHEAASMVLVLELGAAAQRGLLVGNSPAARYAFFCQCLADRIFAAKVLAQYPMLVRRIVAVIGFWRESVVEMFQRLSTDWPVIQREIFGGENAGPLVGADALGDPHAGGRTVHRLRFESDQRLIYKARPTGMEAGAFHFVGWLNDRGLAPDLSLPFAIDQGTHGWVTYVHQAPCKDSDAVRRFFKRQGGNLALAYILGTTDLHNENLVAAGEYPVIVDMETSFQSDYPAASRARNATAEAFKVLVTSVARTLMLPVRFYGADEDTPGADVSALGFVEGQVSPIAGPAWSGVETDAMRLDYQREVIPAGESMPELDGKRIPAAAYAEDIIKGFEATYDFFARHRTALRSSNGPLSYFEGKRVRQVLRPTSFYFRLMSDSWHPSLLGDAVALEAHLRRRLTGQQDAPADRGGLYDAEVADVINGDVPYFQVKLGARHATSPSHSDLRFNLPSEGMADCRNRIAALGTGDKERQAWLTRVSFADLSQPLASNSSRARRFDRERNHIVAQQIGDRLCETAIVVNGRASWLIPVVESERHLTPGIADTSIHNGLSGIALFLARLSLATRRRRYRLLAIAATEEALALRRRAKSSELNAGLAGDGGLAYALALLGTWLKRPEWAQAAQRLIRNGIHPYSNDAEVGLVSGRAGLIAAGTAVAQLTGDPRLLNSLRAVAEELAIARVSVRSEDVAGLADSQNDVGFAIARWAIAADDKAVLRDAHALIVSEMETAERTLSKTHLAGAPTDWHTMAKWSYGRAGAALATLPRAEANSAAAQRMVRQLDHLDPSTAALNHDHGLLGMIEFLEAAQHVGMEGAAAVLDRLKSHALGRILSGEWCANGHHLEAPGLFVGLAGTGYALLRMLDPATPSFLALDAPTATSVPFA